MHGGADARKVKAMSGRHRPLPRLAAACAAAIASLPAIAAAQVVPFPLPLPYSPYSQPAPPSPYAQPLPYSRPNQAPGYQPLPNNAEEGFTSRRARSWPVLRVSGGAGFTFGPRFPDDGEVRPSFVLDATAGYRLALLRRLFLTFEGGYSFDSEPLTGGHFGTLGLGPELFLGRYLSVGWMPKAVIGESWQGFGIGVRNTVVVPLLFRIFTVEVGHQYLRVDGRLDVHEARAQVGVDLAAAAYVYVWRKVRGQR